GEGQNVNPFNPRKGIKKASYRMPTACMFTLRPLAAHDAPASLARATHAAVLRLLAAADAALAARLHDDEGLKPLTVSNVLGLAARGPTARVSPEREYGLRVT